jgi:hypothetical protein
MADIAMSAGTHRLTRSVTVPEGVTLGEALFLLQVLARVKANRFGRLAVTVGDGRVVDIEVSEKVDRSVFRTF